MRRVRGPAAALLVGSCLVSAACNGSHRTTAAAAPSPSPSRTVIGPPGPLSGVPTRLGSRVFAVKIDNTHSARPQAGLNAADQVYVEQVEGGLTRLLAVFSSHIPTLVGPVRSVRTDNLDLLAEFGGPVAFAFSGGQPAALSVVRSSPIVDVSFDRVPADYFRQSGRPAPYDLFANPQLLMRGSKGVQVARPMGFHFDVVHGPTTGLGSVLTVRYPAATLTFTYRPATHDYAISQDGTPAVGTDGKPEVAANVVVQRVLQVSTALKDIRGNFTPANITVGSGYAAVLRDGHSIPSLWERPTATSGTRLLTTTTRRDVSLRPGTTWVLLLPASGGMSIT